MTTSLALTWSRPSWECWICWMRSAGPNHLNNFCFSSWHWHLRMPKGSDKSWVEKLYEKCKKYVYSIFVVLQILICFTMLALRWEHFAKPRLSQTAFLVKHFADQVKLSKRDEYWNRQKRWIMDKTVKRRMGRDWIKPRKENGKRSIFAQVEYECDGFLHKNRDTVMEEQVWFHGFLENSVSWISGELFQVFDIFRSRSWKPPRTTLSPIFSFLKVGNRWLLTNHFFQPLVHKRQN